METEISDYAVLSGGLFVKIGKYTIENIKMGNLRHASLFGM